MGWRVPPRDVTGRRPGFLMDFQDRAGNKGAGLASASDAARDRRERLRRLAMETIDVSKDPYLSLIHI